MTEGKITPTTSAADVLPAVARFIGRYDKEEFTNAPVTVQEMFEDIMLTAFGDDGAYRDRMLFTLNLIRDFGDTMDPFSQLIIHEAVAPYENE